ncbi:hypothetical protein AB0K92_28675 [Streptomyces sp. NPDC052687]|uniref:hypothetical protein n=1 Tax=Streptomyces sp. NPDC052687 TaxID=3154759 RepID=UPI003412459B
MLAIISAILFLIAFILGAADIETVDLLSATNLMLLGLTLLALHVAGLGSGRSTFGRRR